MGEKELIGQLIDNQLMILKKLDILTDLVSKLTNTIIKYDDDYQAQIAGDVNNVSKLK